MRKENNEAEIAANSRFRLRTALFPEFFPGFSNRHLFRRQK